MRMLALFGLAAFAASAARAAECPACAFDCPEGTTNCWSCGTRLPGSPNPGAPVRGRLIVVCVLPEKPVAAPVQDLPDPTGAVEAAESWIEAHPDDYAGAIERLEPLLADVRGTDLEARVERAVAKAREHLEAASRPMTIEDRAAKAVKLYMFIRKRIKSNTDHASNVREIEKALAVAKDTIYETAFRKLLSDEKAKLKK